MWAISAVVAMPPSTSRAGAGAWTIGPSQARQAYLGRIVRSTRSRAGTRSSASLVSSPIRCICPVQHGHSVDAGSITCSTRGRCAGSAPMLRFGLAPLGSRRRPVPVRRRWPGAARRRVRSRSKRELLGADDRRALRPRAEDQGLQRRVLSAQIVVFAVESQQHLDESRSVLGEIFGAKRHNERLYENARNRQQNKAIQATFVGRFVTFGTTRDHSERPSISIASCAPVTRIVPSRTGGQAKSPSSSHFVAKISPVPS